jgi:hypothetical protein
MARNFALVLLEPSECRSAGTHARWSVRGSDAIKYRQANIVKHAFSEDRRRMSRLVLQEFWSVFRITRAGDIVLLRLQTHLRSRAALAVGRNFQLRALDAALAQIPDRNEQIATCVMPNRCLSLVCEIHVTGCHFAW